MARVMQGGMAHPGVLTRWPSHLPPQILMGSAGYGFKYATTLSALHFVVCSAALKLIPGQQPVQSEKSGGGRLPVNGEPFPPPQPLLEL